MRSISAAATILFAAVGICCGIPLLVVGAVGAALAGLGLASAGAVVAGVGLVVLSLVLLVIRRAREARRCPIATTW